MASNTHMKIDHVKFDVVSLSEQMTSNFKTRTVINYNYKFGWRLRAWQSCHALSYTTHTHSRKILLPLNKGRGREGGRGKEKWPQISQCIISTCEKMIFLRQPTNQLTNLFNLIRKLLLALEKLWLHLFTNQFKKCRRTCFLGTACTSQNCTYTKLNWANKENVLH